MQLNYIYYRSKCKKRHRIKNKLKKERNKTYCDHESLTWNHQTNFRKNKHSLQNNIKYECNDIKYKRFSKPEKFKSNIEAYKDGFSIGYKTGSYDGHCNIYNKYDIIGYQDDSYYIGKLKGYDMGYKNGKDCEHCNNKYDFDGYEQNMIGLRWSYYKDKSNNNNNNNNMKKEHINLIELKWSDNYGYYSYDSFGWTLYTELTNKNDPIYNGIQQDIKAELNKKLKIPIYEIQMKTKKRKNNKKNNNYFISNTNRIYVGPKQYIDKYSTTFLKWIQPSNKRYTRYYYDYFDLYSLMTCCRYSCKCTNYYHLSKCEIKTLAKTLNSKYKNICSDVLTTIVPDLRQSREEIGYIMMYNTALSNHGSDIIYIVLDFVFPRKIIDYFYQIEQNIDLCTKMNGDNFINSFKKLDKKLNKKSDKNFDKKKMLKQVNIYDELEKYIHDNGGNDVVEYLNTKNAKQIINNVRNYGIKYYEEEVRSIDSVYHYDYDYYDYGIIGLSESDDVSDLTPSNINCISYTKLNVEYRKKNKCISSYLKKKYRKNNKRVFSKKKNKKIRGKDKKEINYKRWNKMRKHKNDTKNRFNLQYYL